MSDSSKIGADIPGGLADGKPDERYDQDQLAKGIGVEMEEHTDDPEAAKDLTKDHLEENEDFAGQENEAEPYYDGLGEMEDMAEAKREGKIDDSTPADNRIIADAVRTQDNLDDESMHELMMGLGVDPHEGEELIYSLLQQHLQANPTLVDPATVSEKETDEEEEKAAMSKSAAAWSMEKLGYLGTGIGALTGMIRDRELGEDRGQAIGRSALTGLGTDIGMVGGGGIGALLGALIGGGISEAHGNQPGSGMLPGAAVGGLGGAGLGGILGYLMSRRNPKKRVQERFDRLRKEREMTGEEGQVNPSGEDINIKKSASDWAMAKFAGTQDQFALPVPTFKPWYFNPHNAPSIKLPWTEREEDGVKKHTSFNTGKLLDTILRNPYPVAGTVGGAGLGALIGGRGNRLLGMLLGALAGGAGGYAAGKIWPGHTMLPVSKIHKRGSAEKVSALGGAVRGVARGAGRGTALSRAARQIRPRVKTPPLPQRAAPGKLQTPALQRASMQRAWQHSLARDAAKAAPQQSTLRRIMPWAVGTAGAGTGLTALIYYLMNRGQQPAAPAPAGGPAMASGR